MTSEGSGIWKKVPWEDSSCCAIVFFFFSSRRRHTRYWRDWSSDVCSSDLEERGAGKGHDERGGAPGDRVHLPEIAERVGADQEQLVAGVQQRRSGEPGPEIGRASCRERV